jgi:hypothetical protein
LYLLREPEEYVGGVLEVLVLRRRMERRMGSSLPPGKYLFAVLAVAWRGVLAVVAARRGIWRIDSRLSCVCSGRKGVALLSMLLVGDFVRWGAVRMQSESARVF